jgi:hypothetical protein
MKAKQQTITISIRVKRHIKAGEGGPVKEFPVLDSFIMFGGKTVTQHVNNIKRKD